VWLDQLYDYMNRRLLGVTLRNEVQGLVEVEGLLRELRGAWSTIASVPRPVVAVAQATV
jgi:flagellar secretion chaperone FliS